MSKHRFNVGRICEYCAGHADELPKVSGKFVSCSEMGNPHKHKFNSGRVCERCAEHSSSLLQIDGKFVKCPEADEGKRCVLSLPNIFGRQF